MSSGSADRSAERSADPSGATAPRPRRRWRRVLAWVLASLALLLLLAVGGLVVWSQVGVMQAEAGPLADVQSNPEVTFTDTSTAVILEPAGGPGEVGLVYIPGAKVEAAAYAATMADVVAEDGVTVVITKPWLNLAFFDLRPLSAFTDLVPGVEQWIVGGHSLGGVRACQLVGDADALALFASYCAGDISESDLPVISIAGSDDGLSTPEQIADARPLLPEDAVMAEIEGANHAAFGAYGPQAGNNEATITLPEMRSELAGLLAPFVAAFPR
ncbi:pimeloyl-ACP methyl ester carboxylesterase [Microbacterium sp. AK009]|uniref:alpha/beta hydrolase n=1 Tax=Microbacterium sp. AK009 TaxID=2723068 RepID=UPI0017956A73|nr:alpha/beta hydrolase [Microbacterium sp. AK009]NYF15807.1 pimeloyl-ACP methyl ester carboxylesterase [Microbacterium sp. AK009]